MEKKKSTPKSSIKKVKSPPKSAKKSVGKTAERRGMYTYTKLGDLFKEELERVYVYAIVLDCSAPYYVDSISKYLCTVKLIDDTVNPRDSTGSKPAFMTTTVFCNTRGEVPIATKVGTIMRIHRGDTRKFGKTFQLNCDTGIKAAWALFDPTESYTPVAHTGHSYTFIEDDKKRLKDLRKFGEKFLTGFDVTDAASIGAKKGETDMFCLVLNRKEKDKTHDRLTVFDGEKFFKMDIIKERYTHIAPQDIVRVRGMTKKGSEFIFNDYSNILKINKDYGAAEELQKKIQAARKNKDVSDKIDLYFPSGEARVVGEVLDKKAKLTSLKELFSLDTSKLKEKRYKVKVNVLEIGPKDPKSWLIPIEPRARKQYNLPEAATHYYKLQLFSKDASAPEDHNIYTLYLCTIDGKGAEFLPEPAAPKTKKAEKEHADLKKIYKTLTRPWVTLELALEGVPIAGANPIFFIVDTKLNL